MADRLYSAEHQEQHMDDLTEIRGIGQAIEQKLNEAGFFTFSQLANTSTEELATLLSHMPGWSVDRERDLINQARNLVEKRATVNDPASDNSAQYLAQFSIDLLLDTQKHVRRTHIIHVQSDAPDSRTEDVWADWDEKKLTNFVLKNAMIMPERKRNEKVETKTTQQGASEAEKQATTKERAGDLKISDVVIQTASGAVTHWLAKAEEPFTVRLSLNMSWSSVPPGTPLQYQAKVYINNLTNGNRQNVSDSKGTIVSKGRLPLTINCNPLPLGCYRMEVSAILAPDEKGADPKSRLAAITKGKLFSVS